MAGGISNSVKFTVIYLLLAAVITGCLLDGRCQCSRRAESAADENKIKDNRPSQLFMYLLVLSAISCSVPTSHMSRLYLRSVVSTV